MENLGLGYLGAVLTNRGFGVEIIDTNFSGEAIESVVSRIVAARPLLLGFSLFFNNAAETLATIRRLRECGFTGHVTLGGHHATFYCQEILKANPGVDSVVQGEAEEALPELAGRLAAGRPWHDIGNLVSRVEAVTRVNPCRPLVGDLDSLPFPLRTPYAQALRAEGSATVVSSRGCHGRCTFCSIRAFHDLATGRPWRGRSPESVAGEIESLVEDYGVKHINFADDDFFGPGRRGRDRAMAIGDALVKRKLNVTFLVSCRPDSLDEVVLLRLREAGLICVDIGIESWQPRQLAFYGKKVGAEDNWRAVELLRRTGLQYRLYLIPFDPFTTLDELLETAETAGRVGVTHLMDMWCFSRLLVFGGTPLSTTLRQKGVLCPRGARPAHEGELEYSFADPRVERFFRRWHGIQPAYADLDRRTRGLFDLERSSNAAKVFALEVRAALKESLLDLFRRAISNYRRGDVRRGDLLMVRNLKSLARDVAALEKARERGRFRDFHPQRLALGRRELFFPDEDTWKVGHSLAKRLGGLVA